MGVDNTHVTRAGPGALWTGCRPFLTSLDVELTERCDNRCIHCCINLPEHDHEARERELSTDRVLGILDEAAALGGLLVRFTGGEVLLREDLEPIYLYARRLAPARDAHDERAQADGVVRAEVLARVPPRTDRGHGVRHARRELRGRVPRPWFVRGVPAGPRSAGGLWDSLSGQGNAAAADAR